MAEERMPKVNLTKDSAVNKNIIDFIKIAEEKNFERVQRLQRIRKNNLITACTLGVSVLSIYAYSFFAVKQESFLDDFEAPQVKDQL